MKKTDTKLHDALDAVGERVEDAVYKHENIPFRSPTIRHKQWICNDCGSRHSNEHGALHHYVSKHVRDA